MSVGLCIAAVGGAILASLPGPNFTLSWTHSVEKTEWRESYRVIDQGLLLTEARVKGGGAGMEPPSDARLVDDWWLWAPHRPPMKTIVLAASSFTADHRLCAGGECRPLHRWIAAPVSGSTVSGPLVLEPCP